MGGMMKERPDDEVSAQTTRQPAVMEQHRELAAVPARQGRPEEKTPVQKRDEFYKEFIRRLEVAAPWICGKKPDEELPARPDMAFLVNKANMGAAAQLEPEHRFGAKMTEITMKQGGRGREISDVHNMAEKAILTGNVDAATQEKCGFLLDGMVGLPREKQLAKLGEWVSTANADVRRMANEEKAVVMAEQDALKAPLETDYLAKKFVQIFSLDLSAEAQVKERITAVRDDVKNEVYATAATKAAEERKI